MLPISNKKLLETKGIATRSKKLLVAPVPYESHKSAWAACRSYAAKCFKLILVIATLSWHVFSLHLSKYYTFYIVLLRSAFPNHRPLRSMCHPMPPPCWCKRVPSRRRSANAWASAPGTAPGTVGRSYQKNQQAATIVKPLISGVAWKKQLPSDPIIFLFWYILVTYPIISNYHQSVVSGMLHSVASW